MLVGGLAGSAFPKRTPAPPRPPGVGISPGTRPFCSLDLGEIRPRYPHPVPVLGGSPKSCPRGAITPRRGGCTPVPNGGVFGVRVAPFPSWGSADTGVWWGAGAIWGRGVVLSNRCRGPALGSRCCGAVFGAGFEPFWVPACAEVWGSSNFGVQPHTVPLPRSPSSHQPRGAPSERQRGETRGFWRRARRFWEGELRDGVVLG